MVTEDFSDREEAGRAPEFPHATPDVLVIEDEPAVADITCRMVLHAGYSCEWVGSGKEAIRLVAGGSVRPHLFIIDIVLPGLSGIEVARQLAQHCPTAAVILVSAYPQYRLEPPVVERGRFLPKPYSGDELAQLLQELLPRTGVSGIAR
jgi:CheY-like chemotaxis protein